MVRRIPIGDFPFGQPEREALQRVIDSGRISEHREVRAFEEEYANWLGVKHCIAVSSGTAALMCGLESLKVLGLLEPHDRILIPALTFIATANAVTLCNLEPVFGDVEQLTYGLSPGGFRKPLYDAIMPVHLMGYPADLHGIRRNNPDTLIIEDACEAHGTEYCDKKVGTFGLWSAFSFYIAHSVQAGEMGCVCTNSDEVAEVCKRLKAHGRVCACKRCVRGEGKCPNMAEYDPRFTSLYPGFNFKPMEFQAALARVQLGQIAENIERRLRNVWLYNVLLGQVEDDLVLPVFDESVSYMGYPLVLKLHLNRREFLIRLEEKGVEARPLFGCIPLQQPAYKEYKERYQGKLPVSEYLGMQGFYIGCHQYLDDEDVHYAAEKVIETVNEMKGQANVLRR